MFVTPVETYSATFAIELPAGSSEKTYFAVSHETSARRKAEPVRIKGLLPGLHTFTVIAGVEADRAYGQFTVNISDHDVDGLRAKLVRGVNVTGTIRILEDGASLPAAEKGVPVGTLLSEFDPEPLRGDPNCFQAEGVAQGVYRLQMRMPDGFAITDILLDGVSTDRRPFTLNSPAELTVLVTSKPATITGTIRDKNQAPVKGARIALIPLRSDDSALIKRTQSGEGGAFVFRNLAPGRYRIEGADPVEVEAGERATIDVVR